MTPFATYVLRRAKLELLGGELDRFAQTLRSMCCKKHKKKTMHECPTLYKSSFVIRNVHNSDTITIYITWILTCCHEMLCNTCTLQIQPRKHALQYVDHADHTAPARKHELDYTDHTDHTDHTDQESIYLPGRSRSSGGNRLSDQRVETSIQQW